MSNDFKPLQGMSDITGNDVLKWQQIEEQARTVFDTFGYSELRTPLLEKSEVFLHSLGDSSDIVKKEMYALEDRGGRSLVLRPECTAGTIRYLASLGEEANNLRVYYIGPMFRCERPQAGRKRQFHQIGAEFSSSPNPYADVESIMLQFELLKKYGINDSKIKINTLGSQNDKKNISHGMLTSLNKVKNKFPAKYQNRIDDNVLRVLDWKDEECKKLISELPLITSFMSEDSLIYFNKVKDILTEMDIEIEHDPKLVRGLDYYNHTVWEITHNSLGSQDAIAGGGRYTIQTGKKQINGVGFALGIERLILASNNEGEDLPKKNGYWIVSLGENTIIENMKLSNKIRSLGHRCGMELENKSIKSQLRKADKFGATKVLIRGDQELINNKIIEKNLDKGSQQEFDLNEWIGILGERNASI